MNIALGSDHHGVDAVRRLAEHLSRCGHEWRVLGPPGAEPSDYPDSAFLVGRAVQRGEADFGILVCGSGIGMSIAANKLPGVRAGRAMDEHDAEMARRHNDANVLCLSGGRGTPDQFEAITDAFLAAPFDGGRHERRVKKIAVIERGGDPEGGREGGRKSREK